MNLGWARTWRSNGWRKADKKPAQNTELWEKLLELDGYHEITFVWVRGHNGHPENERCDKLAVEFYRQFKETKEDEK